MFLLTDSCAVCSSHAGISTRGMGQQKRRKIKSLQKSKKRWIEKLGDLRRPQASSPSPSRADPGVNFPRAVFLLLIETPSRRGGCLYCIKQVKNGFLTILGRRIDTLNTRPLQVQPLGPGTSWHVAWRVSARAFRSRPVAAAHSPWVYSCF